MQDLELLRTKVAPVLAMTFAVGALVGLPQASAADDLDLECRGAACFDEVDRSELADRLRPPQAPAQPAVRGFLRNRLDADGPASASSAARDLEPARDVARLESGAAAPVPEPSSFVVFATAALALARPLRRHARAKKA